MFSVVLDSRCPSYSPGRGEGQAAPAVVAFYPDVAQSLGKLSSFVVWRFPKGTYIGWGEKSISQGPAQTWNSPEVAQMTGYHEGLLAVVWAG